MAVKIINDKHENYAILPKILFSKLQKLWENKFGANIFHFLHEIILKIFKISFIVKVIKQTSNSFRI